jgi:HPt (histidine-containing phosphotransfer) domain-containing protein
VADEGTGVLDDAAVVALRETVGGDQEFLTELVSEFLDELPVQVAALHAAVAAGDAEQAGRIAHTLKSHGATFGVSRLERCCRELELCAHDGRLGGLEGLLTEVDVVVADAAPALQSLMT